MQPRNPNRGVGAAPAGTRQKTSTASTNNPIAPKRQSPQFVLTLRPLPGRTDPTHQLRRLLKHALRYYGFRCTSLSQEREP
jgi:hypothetical protein